MSPARSTKRRPSAKPHGQIRQSQVVTTFGPGAMVDLPDHAVIIGGLEHWNGSRDHPIIEERLAVKVKTLLGLPSVEFFAPPPDPEDPSSAPTGITAWQFPEWFIAQYEEKSPTSGVRSRPLIHRSDLTKGRYYRNREPHKVVPVRFVQACTRGHVSDIEWRLFVHGKGDECRRDPLWMDERGTSGDLTAITIRCECGKSKALSAATKVDDFPLGYCNGERKWLGNYGREICGGAAGKGKPSRLLVRSASNAYFSQTLSVISIPEAGSAIRRAVDVVWTEFLQYCESKADVTSERRKPRVSSALEGHSDADVRKEIQRRKGGQGSEVRGIREVELEMLLSSESEVGSDTPGGDFYARAIKLPGRSPLTKKIERVVKVHRLREVIAQVGFTRFEASVSDVNGELELDVERAALAREMTWVPAVENRGEGVFVAFKPDVIDAWLARDAVRERGVKLARGFEAWKKEHAGATAKFPGLPFIMVHSLSHLLITAVALDCGYAASSIRERIYVGPDAYGLLLYTASPDAEGTLGGLVEAADRITDYLRRALDLARLCANDPVCAHHQPDSRDDNRFLLGAACHGCVLLPEVSCERRNDFLDRALVVPTVEDADAAFFEDEV
jgi:hypothetical protein